VPAIAFGTQIPLPDPHRRSSKDDKIVRTLVKHVAHRVNIFDVLDHFGVWYPYPRGNSQKLRCIFPANHPRGDQNPSAKINAAKNRYTCYSCDEGGDPLYVAKALGRFTSIGKTIEYLDMQLGLDLANDPVLRKKIDGGRTDLDRKEDGQKLIRMWEEAFVECEIQIRRMTPTWEYLGCILPMIEYWWDEWTVKSLPLRQEGNAEPLRTLAEDFLRDMLKVRDRVRSKREQEERSDEDHLLRWAHV